MAKLQPDDPVPTVVKPLELSRERISEHVWRVMMSDGSVQEEISVKGMVLNVERKIKRGRVAPV